MGSPAACCRRSTRPGQAALESRPFRVSPPWGRFVPTFILSTPLNHLANISSNITTTHQAPTGVAERHRELSLRVSTSLISLCRCRDELFGREGLTVWPKITPEAGFWTPPAPLGHFVRPTVPTQAGFRDFWIIPKTPNQPCIRGPCPEDSHRREQANHDDVCVDSLPIALLSSCT